MHKILMHTPDRINNREPMLWNVACDYEIHNMLYVYLNSLNKDTGEITEEEVQKLATNLGESDFRKLWISCY